MAVNFFLADDSTWGPKGHSGPVSVIGPVDKDTLITGGRDATIRRWKKRKLEDGKAQWVQEACLRQHRDWITDICVVTGFYTDDQMTPIMFSSAQSGILRSWKNNKPDCFAQHEDHAHCLAWMPHYNALACGGLGYLAFYKSENLAQGKPTVIWDHESIGKCYSMAVGSDGEDANHVLLVGGLDTVKLFDIREYSQGQEKPVWMNDGKGRLSPDEMPFPIRSLAIAPDCSRALSASRLGVSYWDLRGTSRRCVSRFDSENRSYWSCCAVNGFREFVAGGKVFNQPYKGEIVRASLLTGETVRIQKLDSPVLQLKTHGRDLWTSTQNGEMFCQRLEPRQEAGGLPQAPAAPPPKAFTALPEPTPCLPMNRVAVRAEFDNPTDHLLVEYQNPKSFAVWDLVTQSRLDPRPEDEETTTFEQLKKRHFKVAQSLEWLSVSVSNGYPCVTLKSSNLKKSMKHTYEDGKTFKAREILKNLFKPWWDETEAKENSDEEDTNAKLERASSTCKSIEELSVESGTQQQQEEQIDSAPLITQPTIKVFIDDPRGSPKPGFWVTTKGKNEVDYQGDDEVTLRQILPNWITGHLRPEKPIQKSGYSKGVELVKLNKDPEGEIISFTSSHTLDSFHTASSLRGLLERHQDQKRDLPCRFKLYCRGVELEPEWDLHTIDEFFVRNPGRLPDELVEKGNKRLRKRKKCNKIRLEYRAIPIKLEENENSSVEMDNAEKVSTEVEADDEKDGQAQAGGVPAQQQQGGKKTTGSLSRVLETF